MTAALLAGWWMRLNRLASGPASVGVCLWRVLGFQGPRRFDATLTQAGL